MACAAGGVLESCVVLTLCVLFKVCVLFTFHFAPILSRASVMLVQRAQKFAEEALAPQTQAADASAAAAAAAVSDSLPVMCRALALPEPASDAAACRSLHVTDAASAVVPGFMTSDVRA